MPASTATPLIPAMAADMAADRLPTDRADRPLATLINLTIFLPTAMRPKTSTAVLVPVAFESRTSRSPRTRPCRLGRRAYLRLYFASVMSIGSAMSLPGMLEALVPLAEALVKLAAVSTLYSCCYSSRRESCATSNGFELEVCYGISIVEYSTSQ